MHNTTKEEHIQVNKLTLLAINLQPHAPTTTSLLVPLEDEIDLAHLRKALFYAWLLKIRAKASERAVWEEVALRLSRRKSRREVERAVEVVVPRQLHGAGKVDASRECEGSRHVTDYASHLER